MSQQSDQKTDAEQPDWLKNHVPAKPKMGNPNWHKGMASPNPSGRKAEFGTARTKIAKMLQDSAGEILDVMIAKARDGDSAAAQLVLSRVVAPLRADSGRVKFDFDPSLPISAQVEKVLDAVATGKVSPEVAQQIVSAIGTLSSVRATEELEQRIIQLEAKAVN
ncbi:hypothetical protein SAMN05444851_2012 [Aliiroseovarius sediminilitoris]|uniref:DUF5681 domain-containing protein n=1 Tax=Aliiroseovarius sediminilitoris TaxID=1173584 RepID=A0A1I0PXT7_9RHOB|nr:hypothetical protein [Aliiroseovarius sediminilitoris]SEW19184.1 hypothetical protein SAMN05444851_2012 [Aliiroseovarius sediminilitoris]